ncbi:sn-glycerol-3-phosphate ABC transporter ATP-binding protein UgpC [Nesterenkonia sp. MY13]|uniref:sn-glycerol-3-phosphate ABC transporter ATP-binding protein UgpC n=1 Tax=Nesterenkonia sedimenti TaxID=1463632 RepID=A0A7X8TKX9_9MICC|nr:sn-glycerol-3-phosphate ABC transporter ATP-binding protein UgpC [Nesterenkonia sedimenti]NLS10578.1 sn-glycerol-3-phosphate ABC transporter ATP-binding protein UgpC [Nesterenkonia sedimenti]
MASITLKNIVKKYGDGYPAVNDVSIDIDDGEFVILVGPSGCGKSTLLRMIVGLEDITDGELLIGGERVNEKAPRDRNLAMVFQNYALYPHLTVFENIAFPMRLAKGQFSEDEVKEKVNQAAKLLELTEHLERKPGNLSGGQRQRVAMGRAIVRDANAFLFDEPLSNLDAKLRGQMRAEISRLQRSLNTTSVYVTHDQTEAMTLGDRVAVLKKGVLQQIASPRELYEQPANLFVAGFIGAPSMNFLPGTVETNSAGNPCLSTPLGEIELPEHLAAAGKDKEIVLAGIRPEFFEEASQVEERRRGHGSVISAELSHVEWLGNEQYGYIGYENDPRVVETLQRLAEDMDSDDLRTQLVVALDAMSRVRGGDTIDLWVETRRIHLFDPATGENLTRDAEAGAELTRLAAEDRKRDRERQASRD